MKVLKPGSTAETLRGRCMKCGCEIECDRSETRDMSERPADNTCLGIECPTCKGWIYPLPYPPRRLSYAGGKD